MTSSRTAGSRAAVSRATGRLVVNVAIALFTLLLVQVFLVRIPRYLAARSSAAAENNPLAAPDWATQVEHVRPHRSGGAGSGGVRDGVPAAPSLD